MTSWVGSAKNSWLVHVCLAAVLAFIIGTGFLIYNQFSQFVDSTKVAESREDVIHRVEELLFAFARAESNLRGHLISSQDRYLPAYTDARQRLDDIAEDLSILVASDPVQFERVERLKATIERRQADFDDRLERFRVGGIDAARATMSDEGNVRSEALRAEAREIASHEQAALDNGRKKQAANQQAVYSTLLAAVCVNSASLLLFYSFLMHLWRAQGRVSRQRSFESKIALGNSGRESLEERCHRVLKTLQTHTNCEVAAMYVSEDNDMTLQASIGAGASVPNSISKERGLLGEQCRNRDIGIYNAIPRQYLKDGALLNTESALIQGKSLSLALIPLWHDESLQGVIELGKMRSSFEAHETAFLRTASSAIAITISALRYRDRLRVLLKDSQLQRERLQAQQEELRVSNEELTEQTRALQRAHETMQAQQEKLRQSNEELESQASALEEQRALLRTNNSSLTEIKTNLEQKTAELEQASQYKSEFLANMSHELRTPLNSLLILSSLLEDNRDGNLTAEQVEFASTIKRSGRDLLNLINDILDLSKIEAGKLTLNPEWIGIDAVVDHLKEQFAPLAAAKDLELQVDTDALPVGMQILTDAARLEQILKNFLSNAIKFTENGTVRLVARPLTAEERRKHAVLDNDSICFEVIDTGVGIEQGKLSRIFEAFEQGDGSIQRRYGGTGLGLTISRQLASLLSSEIFVASQKGSGSTFSLIVPVAIPIKTADLDKSTVLALAAQDDRHEKPMSKSPSLVMTAEDEISITEIDALSPSADLPPTRTLLIIEDDASFANVVAAEARRQGYEPLVAGDARTALDIMKQGKPSAMVLDVRLPDGNGLLLLERLKRNPHLRDIPVHVISAYDHNNRASKLGALGFLRKPVELSELQQMFARIEPIISRKVKKLLIVEDDQSQRLALAKLLENRGIEIAFVATGADALRTLAEETIDCMILDLKLPDTSGLAVLKTLDENEGDVSRPPVIVYTGADLTKEHEERLLDYAETTVIKGAKSPERLLSEVNLFLHRVNSPPSERSLKRMGATSFDRGFSGKKVLLVDDDLRNVFALSAVLEQLGFEVSVARDGVEALERLENDTSIDVALMDIMMPRMDGWEATRRIRSLQGAVKDLPIIALTAKAMQGDREKCLDAGANDYLPKPIDIDKLISTLNVWVST